MDSQMQQRNMRTDGWIRFRRRMYLAIAILAVLGIALPLTLLVVYAYNFTDEYPQCGDGKVLPLNCYGGHWQQGHIGPSTDTYFEGMGVPQRALWGGIGSGSGTVAVQGPYYTYTWWISASKDDIHGYDFIMSIDQAIQVNKIIAGDNFLMDLCGGAPSGIPCSTIVTGTMSNHVTVTFPVNTFKSGTGAVIEANRYYSSHQQAFMNQYGFSSLYGDLYADAPIQGAYITSTVVATFGSDTPIGDTTDVCGTGNCQSWIKYTLYFTTTAVNAGFWYAPHLALSGNNLIDPLTWGNDLGAASITGSSWHVKGSKLNGVGGSQDNMIDLNAGAAYPINTLSGQPAALNTPVADIITVTQGALANGNVEGTAAFYICHDPWPVYSPIHDSALEYGCPSTTDGLSAATNQTYTSRLIGTSNVTWSSGNNAGLATGPTYVPTEYGAYCWLVVFTPTNSSGLRNYSPSADTNGGSECFLLEKPTAVELTSFAARAEDTPAPFGGLSVPLLFIGLFGVVASVGIWRFWFRHG